MIFLTWIKSGLGGAVWPAAVKRGHSRWTWTAWGAHLMCLGAVVAGLAHLNVALDLERALRSPWPMLHRYWLPALFLTAYVAVWLLHGLSKVLSGSPKARSFADIDAAWADALQALREADIPLSTTPVYLLLGRPAGSEDALFQAAGMKLVIVGTPGRKESPLRVFAHRQGIYITCAGASLLGRQASHLLEAAIHAEPANDDGTASAAPVGSREMIDLYSARLHHLCRLIAQARSPFGPINGILMLLPLAATNDAAEARQTAQLARLDLETVREGVGVNCPLYVMVCDLEKSPGFADVVAATSPDQRPRALACRFPLVPDIVPAELPELVSGGVRWLLQVHLPTRLYPLLRLVTTDAKIKSQAWPRNEGLVRFLAQMHFRARRLASMIERAVCQVGKIPMLGGVFLAATGADAEHGQAFAAEVFADLARTQNYVAWSEPALADETRLRRAARAVFAGAAVLSSLVIAASLIWLR